MAAVVFPYPPEPQEMEPPYLVLVSRKGARSPAIVGAGTTFTGALDIRTRYINEMMEKGYAYQRRGGRHFLVKREGKVLPKTIRLRLDITLNATALLN